MANVLDLKKELYSALQDSSEIASYNAKLRDKYEKREKDFNREREQWDRDRKKWSKKLGGIVTENQNLQFENASKAISLANAKSEIDIKSKEITTLRSMEKILENRLTSAQNDVVSTQEEIVKKESEITSLKSELVNLKSELVLKISELDCQKSEVISKPVIGGDVEKNISKSSRGETPLQSNNISAISEPSHLVSASGNKDLSKYFVRRKNMDPIEKIDGEITELPKNDTEINSKVSDETNINEISEDIIPQSLEIPNITPYLTQPENNSGASAKAHMSSLIKPNSQIPIGGMRPSLEALPFPAITSTLMSSLSAHIFLILLIIAVVWFVVRRTWGLDRKSERLLDTWAG